MICQIRFQFIPTDLAARNVDAVSLCQLTADLLPLAVVEETLDSDISLHVIAINFTWRDFEQQCFRPSRPQFSRPLSTAGFANVNGLVGDEIPMFQCDNTVLDRLLNFSRSPALETEPCGWFQVGPDPHGGEDPMAPVLMYTSQLQPHRRDRRKAGFFLPSS